MAVQHDLVSVRGVVRRPLAQQSAEVAADAGRLAAQFARVDAQPHQAAPCACARCVDRSRRRRRASSRRFVPSCSPLRGQCHGPRTALTIASSSSNRSMAVRHRAGVGGCDELHGVAADFGDRPGVRANRPGHRSSSPRAPADRTLPRRTAARGCRAPAYSACRCSGANVARRAERGRLSGGRSMRSSHGPRLLGRLAGQHADREGRSAGSPAPRRHPAACRHSCAARACRRTGRSRRRGCTARGRPVGARRANRSRSGRRDVEQPFDLASAVNCDTTMTRSARCACARASAG